MRWTFALLLALATAAPAHAGWWNSLGRHLGLGWSDGYHAAGPSSPRHFSNFAIPPGGLASPELIVVPSPSPTPATPPLIELPPP